jgi:tetratricopeptide (TPR) repeat protein
MNLRRSIAISILAVAALSVAAVRPALAEDRREVQARQLFGVGKYAEALEIFGNLYAETLHPTYLRNVGRCYQNLREPDKAISSFSEYLRQAKNLAPAQRAEVEGYIREMEELKRKQKAETAAGGDVDLRPRETTKSASPRADALVSSGPESARDRQDTSSPIYTRWWFWTAAAVLVAGGVAGVLVLRSDGTPSATTTFGTMGADPKP